MNTGEVRMVCCGVLLYLLIGFHAYISFILCLHEPETSHLLEM